MLPHNNKKDPFIKNPTNHLGAGPAKSELSSAFRPMGNTRLNQNKMITSPGELNHYAVHQPMDAVARVKTKNRLSDVILIDNATDQELDQFYVGNPNNMPTPACYLSDLKAHSESAAAPTPSTACTDHLSDRSISNLSQSSDYLERNSQHRSIVDATPYSTLTTRTDGSSDQTDIGDMSFDDVFNYGGDESPIIDLDDHQNQPVGNVLHATTSAEFETAYQSLPHRSKSGFLQKTSSIRKAIDVRIGARSLSDNQDEDWGFYDIDDDELVSMHLAR